ncbi:hypothetical protein A3D80_02810 [Candidatus Roizmanbacteria bacterium RIFCSPHIGHO2_02_FULL_40_13b]|nr:MAG: hypothetical protein A3D80_02810 [Candidatus Roizmanbacteria bacterium RIFCSPHIGHO2_02_FULL_40_13b]OGK49281.1 MAG: hypothetical protein A3A56_00640 [Candidatus Roizmanbacteria bacterium RIFCSPLOWO2_01_FULL_40_32]
MSAREIQDVSILVGLITSTWVFFFALFNLISIWDGERFFTRKEKMLTTTLWIVMLAIDIFKPWKPGLSWAQWLSTDLLAIIAILLMRSVPSGSSEQPEGPL